MPKPVNPKRAAARANGRPHFEGTACSKGHTLRHVRSGACVACQAEAQRQRRRTPTTSYDAVLG